MPTVVKKVLRILNAAQTYLLEKKIGYQKLKTQSSKFAQISVPGYEIDKIVQQTIMKRE